MMAMAKFLIFVTILVFVEFLEASPTRRQYIAATESSASVSPVTNDGTEWDDNDDFDVDGEGWFSEVPVSPSPAPDKAQEYNEYEDYSRGNVMVDFGEDDDDQDDQEEGEDHSEQDAEEDESGKNDSEFLFVTPKDTRLMLEDDDDDQSGPIKVRHTGRSSYSRISEEADNYLESSDEEDKSDNEHPYEFTIDEDDRNDNNNNDDNDDDNDDEDSQKDDDSVEVLPRQESHEDDDDEEDELVSESDDDNDMFDNPEEEAAEVIYGDHVFLY